MTFWHEGITRVVGHRGSPRKAVENTLDSFDQAEADGAEAVELDVRLTADGEVVVHHDADILFREQRVQLSGLSLYDFSSITLTREGRSAPTTTLRDVFFRYGGTLRYLVEMKACASPKPGLLEYRTAVLLSHFNLFERAIVLSFSADMLRRIKEVEPAIETCLVFDTGTYRPHGQLWPDLPVGCRSVAPNVALATPSLLREAQAAGLGVHVWTVNDPERARELAEGGARSVITDVPAEISPVVLAVRETVLN